MHSGIAQGNSRIDSIGAQNSIDSVRKLLEKAIQQNDLRSEAEYRHALVDLNLGLMAYDQIIGDMLKALHIYERLKDSAGMAECHLSLQASYREAKDYLSALNNSFAGLQISLNNGVKGRFHFPGLPLAPLFYGEISQTYVEMKKFDSALIYDRKALDENLLINGSSWNFPYYLLGLIQTTLGHYDSAMISFKNALPLAVRNGFPSDTLQISSGISTLYNKMNQLDSAIYYATMVVRDSGSVQEAKTLLVALENLVYAYKKLNKKDSALKYLEVSSHFKDNIYSEEKLKSVRDLASKEIERQREISIAKDQFENKIRTTILIAGLIALLVAAGLLWRNNVHRKKSYIMLEKQKLQTEEQKAKAESALENLKAAQQQLVLSEKMASLGEVTAGIAHEIQNPLNFVNNFSELNEELMDDLSKALDESNIEEASTISKGIRQNLEKTLAHGKRADAIVKGMLQHSKSSHGQKELTDINALVSEYLRVAYHGFRAKDKNFNATIRTNLDERMGELSIVPQELGRVLLNLYNNAFYAVKEKKNKSNAEYEPIVDVMTKKSENGIEIIIRDNGIGIPEKIRDKIFQPFFTTKPAGEGTGLGLSISYDIIKSQGGEIAFESNPDRGSDFIIRLN
jgi:two-component system, NtrC family, sensor kinase